MTEQVVAKRLVSVSSLDELYIAIKEAKPGDRIELASGRYVGRVIVDDVLGSSNGLIEIAGADPGHPPEIVWLGSTLAAIHLSGDWI